MSRKKRRLSEKKINIDSAAHAPSRGTPVPKFELHSRCFRNSIAGDRQTRNSIAARLRNAEYHREALNTR